MPLGPSPDFYCTRCDTFDIAPHQHCPRSGTPEMYECSENGCQDCLDAEGPRAPAAGPAYGGAPRPCNGCGNVVRGPHACPGPGKDTEDYRKAHDHDWELVLVSIDPPRRIETVKALREVIPGLGLKEALALASDLPRRILDHVSRYSAEDTQKRLQECGARTRVQ